MPIIRPGTTPAMNKPAIETLPMAPYTTAVMLGGTSAAIVEAAAMIAAMKGGLYPSRFMGPPNARLITARSAVADPEFPERTRLRPVRPWEGRRVYAPPGSATGWP